MELSLAPQIRPQQSLGVSPTLIASVQLLALGSADLAETVQRELEENPALVLDERPMCPKCHSPLSEGRSCARCAADGRRGESSDSVDLVTTLAGQASDADVATLAGQTSDAEVLLADLRLALQADDHAIADALVASLDDRGYLTADPSAIATWLRVDPARVERVLVELRATGPAGIAARDFRECLLLQLDRRQERHDLESAVISEHLQELAAGRYGAVARALGVEREEVVGVRDFIRQTLRPTPSFAARQTAEARLAPPDVMVEGGAEGLWVRLTEPERYALHVCPLYIRLSEQGTETERRHAAHLATRAQEFTTGLERRWETMLRVMRFAVERQVEWVLRGNGTRRPLTRAEVAKELALHESTVSRATRERSVQLPGGRVVSISELFTPGDDAREALRKLLNEDRQALTDSELVEALAARGHRIARRTVAKYRAQLGHGSHTMR